MRKNVIKLIALALIVCLACASCNSSDHMYKHRRSHCDCPTF